MNCQNSYISYINIHLEKTCWLKKWILRIFVLKIYRSQTDCISANQKSAFISSRWNLILESGAMKLSMLLKTLLLYQFLCRYWKCCTNIFYWMLWPCWLIGWLNHRLHVCVNTSRKAKLGSYWSDGFREEVWKNCRMTLAHTNIQEKWVKTLA